MSKKRRTVSVDFDGVLHSYVQPWVAAHIIPDPPVEGAIRWLHDTAQKFDVCILTTRARTWRGRRAIRRWLKRCAGAGYYGFRGYRGIEEVKITYKKLPALIYVDDRGYRFDGSNFPTIQEVWSAKPWTRER